MKVTIILSLAATTLAHWGRPSPPRPVKIQTAADGYAGLLGGCTGGYGGKHTTTVSTYPQFFKAACVDTVKRVVYVKGTLNMTDRPRVLSNKSIVGVGKTAGLKSNGFNITDAKNVIVRGLHIPGMINLDGISVFNSTNVWITGNHFQSDPRFMNDADYYDGQADVTRGSSHVTISWNVFKDHRKTNLVGGDPDLDALDIGRLRLTFHHNYYNNTGTRTPALRFGKGHVYNNYYSHGIYLNIQSRSLGQLLIEGNEFYKCKQAISTYGFVIPEDSPNSGPDGDYERDGYANLGGKNFFGGSIVNITRVGNFTKAEYPYKLQPWWEVRKTVERYAGIPGSKYFDKYYPEH